MLQALVAFLPMIESLAASGMAAGSTAAATGAAAGSTAAAVAGTAARAGAAAGGTSSLGSGFSNIVNKVLGTVETFKSPQQLGEGLQQAQQLADAIAGLKGSMGSTEDKQRQLMESAKARPGEVDPFTGARGEGTPDRSSDPEHLKALAELQSQRASLDREAKAKNSQLVDLHARISQTTNPRTTMQTLGQMGGLAAGGGMAGQLMGMFGGGGGGSGAQGGSDLAQQLANAPRNMLGWGGSLLNMLPGMKLAQSTVQAGLQPMTDLGMNRAERGVASGATQFTTDLASKTLNPFALMRGEPITHMAKLPGLLAEWGEGLVESKRHLMAFNGTLAMAFLEAERRGLIRNIESGQRTSGATAGLSDALQDLQDTMQPMKDTVTIVLARGVEELVRGINLIAVTSQKIYDAIKLVPFIGKKIEEIEQQVKQAGQGNRPGTSLHAFLKDVNQRDLTKPRRIPRR